MTIEVVLESHITKFCGLVDEYMDLGTLILWASFESGI